MRLDRNFFRDPLDIGLKKRYILSRLTGEKIPREEDYDGKDYPLLELSKFKEFSSNPSDFTMVYNGFIFYCWCTNISQIDSQLTRYFQLHRDDTIDEILKDQ